MVQKLFAERKGRMKITVCDSIMGSGKTQAAITHMRENKRNNYIYLTPYLSEVDRIVDQCSFHSPKNVGDGKLDSLHWLLEQKMNIASTHALFKGYTQETSELIRNGNYKLVLDETFGVFDQIEIQQEDIELLIRAGYVDINPTDDTLRWVEDKYDGPGLRFLDIKEKIQRGKLFYREGSYIYWEYPVEIFEAFDEVIILTYMFKAQFQCYYFDMLGVPVDYIGVHHDTDSNTYRFCKVEEATKVKLDLKSKIKILEHEKLNSIGDEYFALSANWYTKHTDKVDQLRKNLNNLYKQVFKVSGDKVMWTTFKQYRAKLTGKGITKGFVSCNARATNEFQDKTSLAYCVNIFFNPFLKRALVERGAKVDEDGYALSEMVQWVWRSAIRKGNNIEIYISSKRMRDLFERWIIEVDEQNA